MLEQTKQIKNALKNAGYNNDEIKVKTPHINGYYKDTEILITANLERQLSLVDQVLSSGLINVVMYYNEDKKEFSYPRYEDGTGKKKLVKYNKSGITYQGKYNM